MPSRKTQFFPGNFYHVFNRGNGKINIFRSDKDRYRFLQALYLSNNGKPTLSIGRLDRHRCGYTLLDIKNILKEADLFQDPLVKIGADVLMPNHFHLLLQEIKEGGIINFMQRLGTSYGKYFSVKHERPGGLFQGRFKAVPVENDDQLKYLIAYINIINPAQLVLPDLKKTGIKNNEIEQVWQFADKYNWSTHQECMSRRDSILVDKNLFEEIFSSIEEYHNFVKNILCTKGTGEMWQAVGSSSID